MNIWLRSLPRDNKLTKNWNQRELHHDQILLLKYIFFTFYVFRPCSTYFLVSVKAGVLGQWIFPSFPPSDHHQTSDLTGDSQSNGRMIIRPRSHQCLGVELTMTPGSELRAHCQCRLIISYWKYQKLHCSQWAFNFHIWKEATEAKLKQFVPSTRIRKRQ